MENNNALVDDVLKKVNLIRDNLDLFDNVSETDLYHYPVIKYTPYKLLKRNINICKTFKLDDICKIKITMLKYDMESKIHTAIELGLFRPPMNSEFGDFDYLPFYQEFNYPSGKRLMHDDEVRNYFSNYIAKLMSMDNKVYAYYSKRIFDLGYSDFYKYFFDNDIFYGQHVDKDTELYNEPTLAFVRGEDAIENYSEYSDVIDKNRNISYGDMYYNKEILNNLAIQDLENNNSVYDELIIDGNSTKVKNEYLYKFNKKLISRYKVLRYASILKDHYKTVDKNMLLACILKDSFIVDTAYNNIISSLHNRRRI